MVFSLPLSNPLSFSFQLAHSLLPSRPLVDVISRRSLSRDPPRTLYHRHTLSVLLSQSDISSDTLSLVAAADHDVVSSSLSLSLSICLSPYLSLSWLVLVHLSRVCAFLLIHALCWLNIQVSATLQSDIQCELSRTLWQI